MIDLLLKTLKKIDFVNIYQILCENHNDFDNSLPLTNKKLLLSIYKNLENNIRYEPLDRLYTVGFNIQECDIEFATKLHNGFVQPYFFIGNKEEKLFFHRFDFVCKDLNSNFNRDKYDIPKYCSEDELSEILKELLKIYSDFKVEFLLQVEENGKV
jgi:hypothetical protein